MSDQTDLTAEERAVTLQLAKYGGAVHNYTVLRLLAQLTRLEQERDDYKRLSAIGTWHNECRPNRWMAARELEKSQAVIDKMADAVTALTAERDALNETLNRHADTIMELAGERNALKTERDALAARLQWQPMETAPKDGTEVLLKFPSGTKRTGCWAKRIDCWSVDMVIAPPSMPIGWMPLPPAHKDTP